MKINHVKIDNWTDPGSEYWDMVAANPDELLIQATMSFTLSHKEYMSLCAQDEGKIDKELTKRAERLLEIGLVRLDRNPVETDEGNPDYYIVSCLHTSEFPYCGYLRNDLTWALDMRKQDGELGYFNTGFEALDALKGFISVI